MASNPKLELFRFSLKHKKECLTSTFRDFMNVKMNKDNTEQRK